MSRPRVASSRTITLAVKVSAAEAQAIDRAKGGLTRSAWLRAVVLAAVRGTR